MQEIIIVGMPRTGSTFMGMALVQHPSIYAPTAPNAMEPFHPTLFPGASQEPWKTVDYHVSMAHRHYPQATHLLYKVMFDQVRFKLEDYLRRLDPCSRVIHMTRNPIVSYASHTAARRTKIWNIWTEEARAKLQLGNVPPNIPMIVRCCRAHEISGRFWRDVFPNAHTVTYSDLNHRAAEVLAGVYAYLGLPPCAAAGTTLRIDGRRARDRYSDYDRIAKELPERYLHYLDEVDEEYVADPPPSKEGKAE